jgi:hypothetical protein
LILGEGEVDRTYFGIDLTDAESIEQLICHVVFSSSKSLKQDNRMERSEELGCFEGVSA